MKKKIFLKDEQEECKSNLDEIKDLETRIHKVEIVSSLCR